MLKKELRRSFFKEKKPESILNPSLHYRMTSTILYTFFKKIKKKLFRNNLVKLFVKKIKFIEKVYHNVAI